MRSLILFLACWGLLYSLSAQYPAWTNYTWGPDAQGIALLGNNAWVATSGGLARIDRSSLEITHFNHANSGMPGNNIDGIVTDQNGNLWLRYSNCLVHYDGSNWQTYFCPIDGVYFNSLDIAPDGTLWLGSDYAGLISFDGATFTQFTNFSNHDHPEARNVTVDAHGRVWFSTNYLYIDENNFAELLPGALMYFNGSNFTVFSPVFSTVTVNGISEIAFDAANHLWVGTSGGGIWLHDGSSWTNFNTAYCGLGSDYISNLAFDIQGNLWISHLEGLDCYDGNTWHSFNSASSELPSNHFLSLVADPSGPVWVGLLEGLVRIHNEGMLVLQLSNSGLSSLRTWNQALDAGGTHWFANQLGLDTFDGEDWGHLDLPGVNDYLKDLEFDSQGRLWLASEYQGLLCYDGLEFAVYNTSNSNIPSNSANCLDIDSLGRIWIGTPYNGVACLDGNAWSLYNTSNSLLPTNQITALEIDADGRVWIGCFYQPNHLGGLAILDNGNWTFYDTINSGLPSILIKTIKVRDGIAWIGTNNGLARFDGSSWEVWNTGNSGLPGNEIDDIDFDSQGHLLVGTHSAGLAHYSGSEWMVWNFQNSGLADGGCSYLLVAPDDQIWIGNTGNGVSVFEHGATLVADQAAIPPAARLRAWPNPFFDRISFSSWERRGETSVGLYNLRGQSIARWRMPEQGELSFDLQSRGLTDLPAGVYIWRFKSDTGTAWCRSLKCE